MVRHSGILVSQILAVEPRRLPRELRGMWKALESLFPPTGLVVQSEVS
jgi:hypothetical protein